VLRGHFNHAIVDLAEPFAQHLIVFCRKSLVIGGKFMPKLRWPGQRQAFVCGHGGGRICVPAHRCGDAKQLARSDMQHNDLVAIWRGAYHADVAVEQQIKPVCRVAFDKNRQLGCKPFGRGQIQNIPNLSFCKVAKRRDIGQQAFVKVFQLDGPEFVIEQSFRPILIVKRVQDKRYNAHSKENIMFGKIATLAAAATLMGQMAFAETFEVKMLNKGEAGSMVFEPAFLNVASGDTVVFVPTDKGHNVESIKGMLPDGVDTFKSKMNKEFSITFETDGVYGIKCTPHYAMGMVGLIQVGDAVNLEAASSVKQKGKAKKRFPGLFEMVTVSE
jgi:pseudoazurin